MQCRVLLHRIHHQAVSTPVWQQHAADDIPLDVAIGTQRARMHSTTHQDHLMRKQGPPDPLSCILQQQPQVAPDLQVTCFFWHRHTRPPSPGMQLWSCC